MTMHVRPFERRDAARLLEVVGATFLEYGMRLDPDGYDRDLKDIPARYAADGLFLTAEIDGRAAGFAGGDLPRPGVGELHRLYIDPGVRGKGLGRTLCGLIEEWVWSRGARTYELWSDVRFFHAHDMYARLGFALMGQRTLEDPDGSVEFGFTRSLEVPPKPTVPGPEGETRSREDAMRDPVLAHRAGMVAAAILDSRTLVRAGRMERGGHVLPSPDEVVPGATGVLFREGVLFGFSRGSESRVHPLFRRQGDRG